MSTTKITNTVGTDETPLRVRRAKVDSVSLFEVKENELDVLEKGGNADIFLNFAIGLLSIFITIVVSLFTTEFKYPIAEIIFICFGIISLIVGILLLILWYKQKNSIKETILTIRNRMEKD